MKSDQPSRTFTYLYHEIIENFLFQICHNKKNYVVKIEFGNDDFPIALEKKIEDYKKKASLNMVGERLDRHKLASCICGAIIELSPIVGVTNKNFLKTVNELYALHVGMNVIKAFMIYELAYNLTIKQGYPIEKAIDVKKYLKYNFHMQFPCEKICDTEDYQTNLVNALYQTHKQCNINERNCFQYDIWAYSNIFFHLELYNRKNFNDTYQEYVVKNNKKFEQDI